jgi:hypothetical protein
MAPLGGTDACLHWARSGAMALCGRRGGPPLMAPLSLVRGLTSVGHEISEMTAVLGEIVELDALALLGERAACEGLSRQGSTSCGGATRVLRSRTDWLAVTLARESDLTLLPAWLEIEIQPDPWPAVAARIASMDAAEVVERAVELGLAASRYAEVRPSDGSHGRDQKGQFAFDEKRNPVRDLRELVVVDLSALWAGPLCGHILERAGARVVKVESRGRPDGARAGPAHFFDLLNGGKESVALDLDSPHGVRALRQLLLAADVVIESSRPRALEQMSITAEDVLATGRPRVWLSITAYGRSGDNRNRIGFGDDTAVAGGLLLWDEHGPCFCADAVADPATALVAAAATLRALGQGGKRLLDVPLAQVAADLCELSEARAENVNAHCAVAAKPPLARPVQQRAPALGEHTAAVLREFS